MTEQFAPGWSKNTQGHLEKTFTFKDFKEAMAFANQITDVAEAAKHHPDLYIAWGKCRVELWTHSVNGLSDKDYQLAAEIEKLNA